MNDSLENFRTMMEFYGRPKYEHDDSLAKWWVKGDGWKNDKIETVVNSLKSRSFFQRFSTTHLVSVCQY